MIRFIEGMKVESMDRSDLTGVKFWFWRFNGSFAPLTRFEAELVATEAQHRADSPTGLRLGDREILDAVLQTCGYYDRFYSAR